MTNTEQQAIEEFLSFIDDKGYPCVAAKAAKALEQIDCLVVPHMAYPADDRSILNFLYKFVEKYRRETHNSSLSYYAAAIIFRQPLTLDEEKFDALLWQRLQGLADLDSTKHGYDSRVDADPNSPHFSFSLMEEAFFIIGIHPQSNREARCFKYPALIFNPHAQFEVLRKLGRYEPLKKAIRKREVRLTGSVNPMLNDFGEFSETHQYSGRQYDKGWSCPLRITHGTDKRHSTT